MKKMLYIAIGLVVMALIARFAGQKKNAEVTEASPKEIENKAIPNANPVDIYTNLEKKGYKIDKKLSSKDGFFWYCDKSESGIDYNVTIASSGVSEIEQIKITANLNGSDPDKKIIAVKPFLKYVSSFPYKENDTQKVADWIEENFNKDKSSITIGTAKFTINGSKFMRLITVEKA